MQRAPDDGGEDAFEDEDPAPPVETADAVHLLDGECEQTRKGAGHRCGGEEDGEACLYFEPAVPCCQEICCHGVLLDCFADRCDWKGALVGFVGG